MVATRPQTRVPADAMMSSPRERPEALTAEDLGSTQKGQLPFVFRAAETITPLVISFPHVGLEWPANFSRPRPQVDFRRNADLDVHTLYTVAPALGAACLEARYSRLLVDLNRAPDDISKTLVPNHPAPRSRRSLTTGSNVPNRGVVWSVAVGNIPILTPPLPYVELTERLAQFHRPYYQALEVLLERRRKRFGYAILLDAHSMPGLVDGDLILGTLEGGSCSSAIEEAALRAIGFPDPKQVLDVRLNDPYRGGEVVRHFGKPERGIHALQLEVNRSLYMNENTLTLWSHPHTYDLVDSRRTSLHRSSSAASRPEKRRQASLTALLHHIRTLIRTLASPFARGDISQLPRRPQGTVDDAARNNGQPRPCLSLRRSRG